MSSVLVTGRETIEFVFDLELVSLNVFHGFNPFVMWYTFEMLSRKIFRLRTKIVRDYMRVCVCVYTYEYI